MNEKKVKNEYRIIKVSKNYKFPSSIYQKETSDEAASSALKGIIRKNNLDDKSFFTFSIKNGEKTYKYTVKNGKIGGEH